MENQTAPGPTNSSPTPQAEVLRPREAAPAGQPAQPAAGAADPKKRPNRSYRPSHRATFIGLGAVIAILAVNAAVIGFVLRKQANQSDLAAKGQVTLTNADLNNLGINRTNLGTENVKLTVAPDTNFKGKLDVDGDASFGGNLSVNSKLTSTSANITTLQAGSTSLSQLNVNGDGTVNTLNLRKDLVVAGVTQLQGALTVGTATVTGNLTVNGVLSVSNFSALSLTAVKNLSVGGHVITSGPTPGVSRGGATGSNGTVSISGNDNAGTISINIGAGAVSGTLANVAFHTAYGDIPKVVITPVGVGAGFYVLNLSTTGFSVGVASALPPGGFAMNYIVEQ